MENLHATDPRLEETHALIASDRVEGTDVRNANGDRIGEIARLMINKRTGQVAYAVMSFGGFLGIGEDFYPIPWQKLTYNPELDAYEINDLDVTKLENAPRIAREGDYDWSRMEGRGIDDYYGVITPF
ncbi:PRC-barrel domain-containing protein [Beijerinckia mobilis]|uniref:PRC-barrel domain-containing protein n=1 Tax=Beijerinckia mobilis TaxID=231434 RepID=UPI00054F2FEC|nr:PRC-barrel domain-containing protein [Beijerinckia mobilis]